MNYRIGLDIGIGSVGWAVVSSEGDGHPARIEDFGTRKFKSGENPKSSDTLCSERRGFRGNRRLTRRRSFRKKLLLNHFKNIGLLNNTFYDDYADCKDDDVYCLKVKGLDEKLLPAELYKCLVHTCNHRGYRDFYEPDDSDEEAGKNESAANDFEKMFIKSGKRTVSEYLVSDHVSNGFVNYRNRNGGANPYLLVRRKLLQEEVALLLKKQSEFYSCLDSRNTNQIITIIFNQRDFEDGPGNPDDKSRRYYGSLGKCPFYSVEDRGFRGTVIADVFAVTNTLSQYRFVNKETGEYELEPKVAEKLIDHLLANAKLSMTDVKKILKEEGFELLKSERSDDKALGKAIKFLSIAKKCAEEAEFDWKELINEYQFDPEIPTVLHSIGELISKYQTPSRRRKEMKKSGIDERLIKTFSNKKISGTASASYKYMCDAIKAFLSGDTYGNYQANFKKVNVDSENKEKSFKLAPSDIDGADVRNNRVVFKAINETRKIVNAIIDVYGSPEDIVIEVASELGESFEMRARETKRQRENEKSNDKIKSEIASLLSIDIGDVKGAMIERYKLYKEQEGKCAYSVRPLGDIKEVVENRNHAYEIDHIVPYSLILDNTLNNKALVYTEENQKKGQRTPLMYMNEEKSQEFLSFVNHMFSRKTDSIGRKKFEYYRLETIYGEKSEEILSAWKSRNINDTRYITKYIAGLFERKLLFSGEKKQHVFTVKGAVTQKFRREWFKDSAWGEYEKKRDTYLNHALDALIAANLTKPYIEIGSDALRLISIYKSHKSRITPEYDEYLEKCIAKMREYYGFNDEYTRKLLSRTGRAPSFVPRLVDEVRVRFYDEDEKVFNENVEKLYGNEAGFIVPPHMPITSHKQEKKYKGKIADENPLKIVEIDGLPHKIKRIDIKSVSEKTLSKVYTEDKSLIGQLTTILKGKGEKYTIADYLKDNSEEYFVSKEGTLIRKISTDGGVVSNFYRKEIENGNYTYLGMLKYYCVEVYKDSKGNTKTCGVRFVDIVNRNGKLYRKEESLPGDYSKHVMYLFANDYVTIFDGKGETKFSGYYISVENINSSKFSFKLKNYSSNVIKSISREDTIKKFSISLLGKIGGEIKCSEPLPCIKEREYR